MEEDERLDGISNSMNTNLSTLWEILKDLGASVLQYLGSRRVGDDLQVNKTTANVLEDIINYIPRNFFIAYSCQLFEGY